MDSGRNWSYGDTGTAWHSASPGHALEVRLLNGTPCQKSSRSICSCEIMDLYNKVVYILVGHEIWMKGTVAALHFVSGKNFKASFVCQGALTNVHIVVAVCPHLAMTVICRFPFAVTRNHLSSCRVMHLAVYQISTTASRYCQLIMYIQDSEVLFKVGYGYIASNDWWCSFSLRIEQEETHLCSEWGQITKGSFVSDSHNWKIFSWIRKMLTVIRHDRLCDPV